jgi:hypothetical protein
MTTHNLIIIPSRELSTVIVCRGCASPEPPASGDHWWQDQNNDVYFDGTGIGQLFPFLIHHDAFNLTASLSNPEAHHTANAHVVTRDNPYCTPECAARNHMVSPG